MYIIHETIGSEDPRRDPKMEQFGSFWHYTIHKLPDDGSVYYAWLKADVISEDVAKAYKFTSAANGEITVKKNTDNWEELAHASGETLGPNGPGKVIYELTVDDNRNTVALMTTVIKNFANNRITDAAKKATVIQLANSATTIEQCRQIMGQHCHF